MAATGDTYALFSGPTIHILQDIITGFEHQEEQVARDTIRGLMKTLASAEIHKENFHSLALVCHLLYRLLSTNRTLLQKDWAGISTFSHTIFTEHFTDCFNLLPAAPVEIQDNIPSPTSSKSSKSSKSDKNQKGAEKEKHNTKLTQRMRALVNFEYLGLAIRSLECSNHLENYLEESQKSIISLQSYSIEMVSSVQMVLTSVLTDESFRKKTLGEGVWRNILLLQEALLTLLDHKNLDTDQAETACLNTVQNLEQTYKWCLERCQQDPEYFLTDIRPLMELIIKFSSSRCCSKLKGLKGILENFTVLSEAISKKKTIEPASSN